MSSTYLTYSQINMIERLLARVRELPRDNDRETERARFLTTSVKGGLEDENTLGFDLADHIAASKVRREMLLPQPKSMGLGIEFLHRLMFGTAASIPPIAPSKPIFAPQLIESRRRRRNDTDGMLRRENEVKRRNQMH